MAEPGRGGGILGKIEKGMRDTSKVRNSEQKKEREQQTRVMRMARVGRRGEEGGEAISGRREKE